MKVSMLYRYGLTSAFLVACTFFVAHTVNAVIEQALFDMPVVYSSASLETSVPRIPSRTADELAQEILRSGMFPVPTTARADTAAGNVPPPPPLNLATKLVLRGTVVGEGRVVALIEEMGSKRQWLYHVGDQIGDVGQLIDVQRMGVLIRQGEQEEFLPVRVSEEPGKGPQPVPVVARPSSPDSKRRIVLDRREVDAAVSDLSKLMAEARASPYFVDGKVAGFQIVPVTTESFFSRIGLISGDILKRVNGVDVRDPGQVLTLFQQVRNERSVKVDILRNEQPTTLIYDIR